MAKPFTAVVLNKKNNKVKLLISEIRTEVEVDLKKLLTTDVKLGQKLHVLYDFTKMTVREVRPKIKQERTWPELAENPVTVSDVPFGEGDISLL